MPLESLLRQRIDDANFDLCWLAWDAGRLSDPEASWHSKTANDKGTNNVSGLQDKIIDSLIEAQKTELNLDARNNILKALDTRLTEIVPYILLWQSENSKILHWRRFGYPESLYGKFNREEAIPIISEDTYAHIRDKYCTVIPEWGESYVDEECFQKNINSMKNIFFPKLFDQLKAQVNIYRAGYENLGD